MKVLVAYASKRGSTAEIAEAISRTLRREDLSVECKPVEEVESVEPYNAVILGSAVYMKRWRGDAKHFLRKYRRELAQMPFWVFSSGPAGDPAKDKPEWAEPPRIIDKVEKLGGCGYIVFGGRLPTDPHGSIEKAMVAMVENTPTEYRDRRDWDEIRRWTIAIVSELHMSTPVS